MPFTTVQLANRMNDPNLAEWAASTLQNQAQFLTAYGNYFNGIQAWINTNGGANPFGWQNLGGLTLPNGTPVVLQGPAQRAPFNDAFDDVRTHIASPTFRLFQAAEADLRLIAVLNRMV